MQAEKKIDIDTLTQQMSDVVAKIKRMRQSPHQLAFKHNQNDAEVALELLRADLHLLQEQIENEILSTEF